MLPAKLLTILGYLLLSCYYGDKFGVVPNAFAIPLLLLSGSLSFFSFWLIAELLLVFWLLFTAFFKPYYRYERQLFIAMLIVFGPDIIFKVASLSKAPLNALWFPILTTLLFCAALYYYGYKALDF